MTKRQTDLQRLLHDIRAGRRPIPAMKGGERSERELLDERNRLLVAMRGILDTAEGRAEGQRSLTGEEQQEFDRMEADVRGLDEQLRRVRSLGAMDREQRELVVAAGLDGGGSDPGRFGDEERDGERDDDERREQRGRGLAGQLDEQRGGHGEFGPTALNDWRRWRFGGGLQHDDEYRSAFYAYLSTSGEWRERLTATERRALAKGGAAALVPIEFERQLLALLRDSSPIRQLARVIRTTTGDELRVPRSTGHGTASWLGEAQAFVESDETFDSIVFNAYKAGTIIRVSEELLEDSMFDLEAYIRAEFDLRIGDLENAAYIAGDGVGKPTGLIQETTLGKTGAAGQVAAVTADDLIDLVYSVRRIYRQNGVFLLNDLTLAAIRKLKDANGQYLWMPGLRDGEPDTLLGYRVYDDPSMPVMAANAKSIAFGDLQHYWIRDVGGIRFQRLAEKYADQGQVGFRAYHRTDGRLTRVDAVKHYRNPAA